MNTMSREEQRTEKRVEQKGQDKKEANVLSGEQTDILCYNILHRLYNVF